MEKVELKNYVDILSGFAFNSQLFNDVKDGIQLIRIRDVGKNFSKTFYPGSYDEKYLVKKGDYLIGMDGDFRLSEWLGENALLNQRVCKISIAKPKELNDKYLLHFLPKELKLIEDSTSYATVKHLSVDKIKKIQIPLPSLPTQQKIAEILDTADQLRQYNKQLIEKYDALTQSLFLDMFGDVRINSNKFPIFLFDEISNKITDGDHLTPKREEIGYKLLSCRNIKNGFIDFSAGLDYVGESEFQRMFKRCNPEKGDILISCSGTIGRTTSIKIDEPFVLVRSAALIKPKRDLVNPYYLEFYLRTDYMQSVMKRSSNTSSQANLFTGPIKKLPIILPTFDLQTQFAERVQMIETQKQQAQDALTKSEALFQSLLQRAFNGTLCP